ncbi:MAG: LamG domain-containing protein [Nanoarchaeota archaeon]|nr:LamG domain-containing protein [Nanoarchaeota archaeon]
MNKKGVIFTYVSLLFLVVIILLFSIYTRNKSRFEVEVTAVVAENMDNFIETLETEYIPAAVKASTNKAVQVLEEEIRERGDYLNGDASDYVRNVLVNGFYPEAEQCISCDGGWMTGMEEDNVNYTLENIARQLEQLAMSIGIKLDFDDINIEDVVVKQGDAWNLQVDVPISYSISHEMRKIKWGQRTQERVTDVLITDFKSPVYLVEGKEGGRDILINKYPDTHASPLDALKLADAIENYYFYENPNAPSFLKMLVGDFSSDPNGISSFIHPGNYNVLGVSATDYNYFGGKKACSPENHIPIEISGVTYADEFCLSEDDIGMVIGEGVGHGVNDGIYCKWVFGEGEDECCGSKEKESLFAFLQFDEAGMDSDGDITPDSGISRNYGEIEENEEYQSAVQKIPDCRIGGCYRFDRGNVDRPFGGIVLANSFSSNEFSLELWMRVHTSPEFLNQFTLFSLGVGETTGINLRFNLPWYAPVATYGGRSLSQDYKWELSGDGDIKVGKWYHISFTCGASGKHVYVNGEELRELASSDTECYGGLGYRFSIGKFIGHGWMLHGDVDEVMIYKRELSKNEIKKHIGGDYDFCYYGTMGM